MKEFDVVVTETYSKIYHIYTNSANEAREIADEMASEDMYLAIPENMNSRYCEIS
jgi:hypothetical protein